MHFPETRNEQVQLHNILCFKKKSKKSSTLTRQERLNAQRLVFTGLYGCRLDTADGPRWFRFSLRLDNRL